MLMTETAYELFNILNKATQNNAQWVMTNSNYLYKDRVEKIADFILKQNPDINNVDLNISKPPYISLNTPFFEKHIKFSSSAEFLLSELFQEISFLNNQIGKRNKNFLIDGLSDAANAYSDLLVNKSLYNPTQIKLLYQSTMINSGSILMESFLKYVDFGNFVLDGYMPVDTYMVDFVNNEFYLTVYDLNAITASDDSFPTLFKPITKGDNGIDVLYDNRFILKLRLNINFEISDEIIVKIYIERKDKAAYKF